MNNVGLLHSLFSLRTQSCRHNLSSNKRSQWKWRTICQTHMWLWDNIRLCLSSLVQTWFWPSGSSVSSLQRSEVMESSWTKYWWTIHIRNNQKINWNDHQQTNPGRQHSVLLCTLHTVIQSVEEAVQKPEHTDLPRLQRGGKWDSNHRLISDGFWSFRFHQSHRGYSCWWETVWGFTWAANPRQWQSTWTMHQIKDNMSNMIHHWLWSTEWPAAPPAATWGE